MSQNVKAYLGATFGLLVICAVAYFGSRPAPLFGGPASNAVVASTTNISLTTTSLQLLATSSKRVAVQIDNTYCTAGGTLFLSEINTATANTGPVIQASSTLQMGDTASVPAPQNAVHGIIPSGTCSVHVTEWRER